MCIYAYPLPYSDLCTHTYPFRLARLGTFPEVGDS